MSDENLEKLLDAVHDVIIHACFYPETEYGTPEMLIMSEYISSLREAYQPFAGDFE